MVLWRLRDLHAGDQMGPLAAFHKGGHDETEKHTGYAKKYPDVASHCSNENDLNGSTLHSEPHPFAMLLH